MNKVECIDESTRNKIRLVDPKNVLDVITIDNQERNHLLTGKSMNCYDHKVAKVLLYLYATALDNIGNCFCMTANQIGFNIRLFMFRPGINLDADAGFVSVLNPKIIARSKEVAVQREACLSYPGRKPQKVRRAKWVVMTWINPMTGEELRAKFSGFDARMILHAYDHFQGKEV